MNTPTKSSYDCGHFCCDERHDPNHDHFLPPEKCPPCTTQLAETAPPPKRVTGEAPGWEGIRALNQRLTERRERALEDARQPQCNDGTAGPG